MSKFKAGDKIQCTGCIDQIDQDGDAYVRFPGGNSKNLTVILAKELERAKLIEPARRALGKGRGGFFENHARR